MKQSPPTAPEGPILGALALSLADVALPADAPQKMALHWQLLCRWNARTNLTAVHSADDAAWLHYRDSLAGLPWLAGAPIVDFGSGGGFPGIPLAIARPAWSFTLVEPRRKRASFLETAVAHLQLRNVRVLCCRLEDAPDGTYAHAVSRATFSNPAVLHSAHRWLCAGATILAYRAAADAQAPRTTRHDYALRDQVRVIEVHQCP